MARRPPEQEVEWAAQDAATVRHCGLVRRLNDPTTPEQEREHCKRERSMIEAQYPSLKRPMTAEEEVAELAALLSAPFDAPADDSDAEPEPAIKLDESDAQSAPIAQAAPAAIEPDEVDADGANDADKDDVLDAIENDLSARGAVTSPPASEPLLDRISDPQRARHAEQFEREKHAADPAPSSRGAYDREGRYAKAHQDVFDSQEFKLLGHWTQLLLYIVNQRAFGSNGFVMLRYVDLKEHGFYRDAVHAAIREAIETGFLRCTRAASSRGRIAATYFPTWLRLPGEACAPDTWRHAKPKAMASQPKKAKTSKTPAKKAA
jgi:hypothetical protein